MRASRKKIAQAVNGLLESGVSETKVAKEVAAYLLSEHRGSELTSIMRDVIAIRADSGTIEAEAYVTHAIGPKVRQELEKTIKSIRPEAKKIMIDEKVDPKFIGGLKLNVIDKSVDFTIRAKLSRLRQLTSQGEV